MIVRILGEGQYELQDSQVAAMEELDKKLVAALDSNDETSFRDAAHTAGPKRAIGGQARSPRSFRALRADAAARDSVSRRAARAAGFRGRRGVLSPLSPRTRFPVDHGLTARMMSTVFLLGLLYALFVTVLFLVGVKLVFIIVIALVVLFVQYFYSDRIALYSMKGKMVTREQAPQLHGVVDRLCAMADMPKPQVAIADVDMPNAFATGRDQKHAVVCVTTGILRRLNEPELEAVLAHELSHVAHRDVAVMTIASFLGILAGLLTRVLLYAGLFGGFGGGGGNRGRGGGGGNAGGQLAILELGMLLFSAVIYAISFLLIRTLSRYRELAADRSGAILIGQPRLLAQALVKVTGEMSRIPTRDLRSAEHFNAFFFAPAFAKGVSLSTLFSTHPTLERRLQQLTELEAQMGRAA